MIIIVIIIAGNSLGIFNNTDILAAYTTTMIIAVMAATTGIMGMATIADIKNVPHGAITGMIDVIGLGGTRN